MAGRQFDGPHLRAPRSNRHGVRDRQAPHETQSVVEEPCNIDEQDIQREDLQVDQVQQPIPSTELARNGDATPKLLLRVPMLAGRGGRMSGTLDKFEAIPGFRTSYNAAKFQIQVMSLVGCFVAAASYADFGCQSEEKLSMLRDVTGTVSSVALQIVSIMSKKMHLLSGSLSQRHKCSGEHKPGRSPVLPHDYLHLYKVGGKTYVLGFLPELWKTHIQVY
ncbi:hypothetical protein MPSEU_000160600 [Mayamaea pseudoterrestris]|nr:hypothetical protein MPSEU_000160600 [Mayamaea pseudoterrestris]